jgi:CBS domain-containing protein
MELTVADIMTKNVKTARSNDSVAAVAKILSDNDISALPVCDDQGVVVGMLSEGDLLRPVGKANAAKRAWWLNLLAEGTDLAPSFLESLRVENRPAHELMVSPAITTTPQASIPEVADLLVNHRIKRLPVVEGGKLIGIVSRADLIRVLAKTPDAIADLL